MQLTGQYIKNKMVCRTQCQCNEHLLGTVKYDYENRKLRGEYKEQHQFAQRYVS